MSATFTPTPEQDAILAAFETGESMVIEAGAGTGKTATLRLMAEATDRRGIYIAYNKAIATDAKNSFPSNVKCATAHSFAYGAVGKDYRARLNGPRLPAWKAAQFLGLNAPVQFGEVTINANTLARLALEMVNRFSHSADEEITERHCPFIEGGQDWRSDLATLLLPFARKAWADLQKKQGMLKFQHDHYLKIWALSHPKLRGDFILLDEAQDANPVIAQVVAEQDHMQKIMVGDAAQAIYGWRGAVDAMTSFNADHRLYLSQSFRFGDAVADEANKWLDLLDAPLRLKGFGNETRVERLDEPDTILCRTNAGVMAEAISAIEDGRKAAIVGGTGEIKRLAEAAVELQQGKTPYHADLVAFSSWDELRTYTQEDAAGSDLKVFVKLIDEYGPARIIEIAEAMVSEADADVILSTAHKAKGREWNNVRIANDFKAPEEGEQPSRPEMMLAYVAVTRARKVLDNSGLAWINDFASEPVA